RVGHHWPLRRGERGRVDRQIAEQAVLFIVDPCREEERAGRARQAEAELESPDSRDVDRGAGRVAYLAQEVARVEVECVDRAVAEVADEQGVVEFAEPLEGGPGHPPWRVELALAGEALEQVA